MHRAQAPPAAVAGADVILIEPGGDRLETHRSPVIDAVKRHPVNAPNRFGLDWVDLQLLLYLRAALAGRNHAVADRRPRPFQNPWRALSFIARSVCLPFSFD